MTVEAMKTVIVIAYDDEIGTSEIIDRIRCPYDFTPDDYILCRLRDDHVLIQDSICFEDFNPFGWRLITYTRPDHSHADDYLNDCRTISFTGDSYDW